MTTGAHAQTHRPAWAHAMWWFLFANGGAISAIFMPVHEIVQGVLNPAFGVPSWTEDAKHIVWTLGNPLVVLYLIVLIGFTFVHTAHRTIYALGDIGLLAIRKPLEYLLYALAGVGTLIAAFVLITANLLKIG